MASEQANESKKLDAQEFDDFAAAGDLCDFGFTLVQPPLIKPAAEGRSESSR